MASLFYFRGRGRAPRVNASLPPFAMGSGQSPSRQRFASALCDGIAAEPLASTLRFRPLQVIFFC